MPARSSAFTITADRGSRRWRSESAKRWEASVTARTPGNGPAACRLPRPGSTTSPTTRASALPKAPASIPVPAVPELGHARNGRPDVHHPPDGSVTAAGLQHLMARPPRPTPQTETWPTDQLADDYLGIPSARTSAWCSPCTSPTSASTATTGTVTAFAPVRIHDMATLTSAVYALRRGLHGHHRDAGHDGCLPAGWAVDGGHGPGDPPGGHVCHWSRRPASCYAITWGGVQQIEYAAWRAISGRRGS